MITTIKGFKESVDTVKKLIEEQRKIALAIRPEDSKWQETMNSQLEKLDSNEFKVLVMGVFSAGKSAFLNAILGQGILPTRMLPATSVITEVRYGAEKKVIVYPKPGRWNGGDEPFEIEPSDEEIAKYGTINNRKGINTRKQNEEGVEKLESPFAKIEIYWPLPILEGGVVLIDSPGLDDPYCHDGIVHDYMPTASAIIYLENATGQRAVDTRELLILNSLSYQPIICITHFDEACKSFKSYEDREEYIEVNVANNSRFTNLGREGIFFLSSVDGLKAKMDGDERLLQESGYKDLESYLESYLIENRAVAHIDSIIGKLKTLNQEMRSAAEGIIFDSDKDNETLKVRVEIAETKLEELRIRKARILSDFKSELTSIEPYVRRKAEEFIKQMPDTLTMDGFEPQTVIPTGMAHLNPVKVHKAAKSLTDEATKFLSQECEAKLGEWCKDVLMPGVYELVKGAASKMQQDFESYQNDLSGIADDLKEPDIEKKKVFGNSVSDILAGIASGWLGAILTPIYGSGTGKRMLCSQLVTSLAILVFPVTLPVAMGAIIASLIVPLITGGDSQTKNIKKKTLEGVKEFYKKPENSKEVVDAIVTQTVKLIADFSASLEKAFSDDIDVVEREIKDKKNSALLTSEQRTAEKKKMEETIREIDKLGVAAEEVISRYMNA
ncbi:MAG: dynamin family protein [Oscillospiraceae bacterium]|nr:dynamin family protein [Oscillospiraceae bacterium]